MIENRRNLRIRPSCHLHIPLSIGFPSVRQWKFAASLEVAILVTNPFLAPLCDLSRMAEYTSQSLLRHRSGPFPSVFRSRPFPISTCREQEGRSGAVWENGDPSISKIPSIFDHTALNSSTMKSYYHEGGGSSLLLAACSNWWKIRSLSMGVRFLDGKSTGGIGSRR